MAGSNLLSFCHLWALADAASPAGEGEEIHGHADDGWEVGGEDAGGWEFWRRLEDDVGINGVGGVAALLHGGADEDEGHPHAIGERLAQPQRRQMHKGIPSPIARAGRDERNVPAAAFVWTTPLKQHLCHGTG